jgi:integrase
MAKTLRYIILNPEALAIFERHRAGKGPDDYVFTNSDWRPFCRDVLAKRLNRIKDVTEAKGPGIVRDEITIHSFRGLWISEVLMTPPNDLPTFAHMAGTSIDMIQHVYAHFTNRQRHAHQARLDEARQMQDAD